MTAKVFTTAGENVFRSRCDVCGAELVITLPARPSAVGRQLVDFAGAHARCVRIEAQESACAMQAEAGREEGETRGASGDAGSLLSGPGNTVTGERA